jgi:hypothetical protein
VKKIIIENAKVLLRIVFIDNFISFHEELVN